MSQELGSLWSLVMTSPHGGEVTYWVPEARAREVMNLVAAERHQLRDDPELLWKYMAGNSREPRKAQARRAPTEPASKFPGFSDRRLLAQIKAAFVRVDPRSDVERLAVISAVAVDA